MNERKYAIGLLWVSDLVEGYKIYFSLEDYKAKIGYRNANTIWHKGEWLTRQEAERLCCDIYLDLKKSHENTEYSLIIVEDVKTNYNTSYGRK